MTPASSTPNASGTESERVRVVVLGAGFGGLTFCQHFSASGAAITVVDRHNHHLFQPLLYQVATAGLSAPEIAQPIRSILSRLKNVTVLMDEVRGVDLDARSMALTSSTLPYDYLVLALGGVTSYFGHPEWEAVAPGLKSLDDALQSLRGLGRAAGGIDPRCQCHLDRRSRGGSADPPAWRGTGPRRADQGAPRPKCAGSSRGVCHRRSGAGAG